MTSTPEQDLTHVRADGSAHMVDVTEKSVTTRTAVAEATVHTRADVIEKIFDADLPKGDALPVARVAGIMGAKRTPEIIPLCHPLPLGKITVDFERGPDFVRIEASVKTRGVTGVEMETRSMKKRGWRSGAPSQRRKVFNEHRRFHDVREPDRPGDCCLDACGSRHLRG